MTVTTEETLTANGVVLNTLAYNVSSLTGRLRTPVRRGANVPVPSRHGAIRIPRKPYEEGEIVLPMWVVGADEDGLVPSEEPLRRRLYANVDMLSRIFSAETVELIHTLPDGSRRSVLTESSDVMDFVVEGGTRAVFAVTLRVPGSFWTDVVGVSASFAGEGGWEPPEFAAATAPMDDLVVTFTGPASNPRITSNGVWLQYSAVLSAGQEVSLHCSDWSLSGSGGLIPDPAVVDHGGSGRWFVLDPGSVQPSAVVSQTGTGQMSTTLTGKRKYLVG